MIIGVEVRLVVTFRTSFTPPEWAGLSFTLHHVLLIAHFVMNSVRLGPDLGTIPLAATEPGTSSSTSDTIMRWFYNLKSRSNFVKGIDHLRRGHTSKDFGRSLMKIPCHETLHGVHQYYGGGRKNRGKKIRIVGVQ